MTTVRFTRALRYRLEIPFYGCFRLGGKYNSGAAVCSER